MTTDDLIGLLGKGGVIGILLFILARVLFRVGERMIAALDRVAAKLDEHTKLDLEHHGETRDAVTRMEAKIDAWNDVTPIEAPGVPRAVARRKSGPVGYYGPRRPPTSSEDE